jgi:ankyrin repeat protein
MWAASKGHKAAMKVLLQAGADPTVQDQVSE